MASSLLTPTMIAQEAVLQVRNALVFGNAVHRDFKKEFVKVGESVTIRRPVQFKVVDGATATAADVTELKTSISVDKQKHVAWKFSSADLTLKIEDYSERYIKPAALALANQVDVDIASLYKDVPQLVYGTGTTGNDPAAFADIARVGRPLSDAGAPSDKLHLILNPAGYWAMANGLSNVYNETINKKIMRDAALGRFGNFDVFMSQNVQRHTNGLKAAATADVVNNSGTVSVTSNAIPNGTLSLTSLTTTDTFAVGDVITIAGLYEVNPITKQSTGQLKKLVVAAATTVTTTTALVQITPGIIHSTTDPYQNASGTVAAGADVLILGATGANRAQNLAFHTNAFGLVVCPLELPQGAGWAARASHEGLSVRLVKDYDFTYDTEAVRMDILYGVKTLYRDLAVRLEGA